MTMSDSKRAEINDRLNTTYPRDKIAAIQHRLNTEAARIRDNTAYSDAGRRVELAKLTVQARKERDTLKADFLAKRAERRTLLQRRLFGLSSSPSAADMMLLRDSQDRAATIDSAEEAANRLALAHQSGDTFMAQAIAQRAANRGWNEVINTYAEHAPAGTRTALEELAAIPAGTRTNLAEAAAFAIREPAELAAFRGDGNLERIAAGETEVTITTTTGLLDRRSVLTGQRERENWDR